ncbi:MAG TPA: hypothetical protein VKA27_00270 [Sunxiuqinia sp.]|nr:hypothetical protein [Sunxiuqinia sp.]
MKNFTSSILKITIGIILYFIAFPQVSAQFGPNPPEKVNLNDMHWRDVCVLPNTTSGYYYMVGPGGNSVLSYRSKDLIH